MMATILSCHRQEGTYEELTAKFSFKTSIWCLQAIFTILSTGSKCRDLYWKILTSETFPCKEYFSVIIHFAMQFSKVGKKKKCPYIYIYTQLERSRKAKRAKMKKTIWPFWLKKTFNFSSLAQRLYIAFFGAQGNAFFWMANLTINSPHYFPYILFYN